MQPQEESTLQGTPFSCELGVRGTEKQDHRRTGLRGCLCTAQARKLRHSPGAPNPSCGLSGCFGLGLSWSVGGEKPAVAAEERPGKGSLQLGCHLSECLCLVFSQGALSIFKARNVVLVFGSQQALRDSKFMVSGNRCFETDQLALNPVARLGVTALLKIIAPKTRSRNT